MQKKWPVRVLFALLCMAIQRNTTNGWVTEYTFTPSNTPSIQAESKYQ